MHFLRGRFKKSPEKDQKYALGSDEIEPVNFEPWGEQYNIEYLQKNSKQRVSKNKDFKLINDNSLRLKKDSDRSSFSLKLDNYRIRTDISGFRK